MLSPESARNLQAAGRAYRAAAERYYSPDGIRDGNDARLVSDAESYIEAKRAFKAALERCETERRR